MYNASYLGPTIHLFASHTTTLAGTRATIMKTSAGNSILRMRILILLLAAVNRFFTLVAADCYWPDGSNAYDMQECYSQEVADGLCCAPGDLCLLNHLCQSNGEDRSLYRGACNMPNWTEAATCPEICVNERDGNNINLTDIQVVDNCMDEPNFFVCDTGLESACAAWNNPCFSMSGRSSGSLERRREQY